MKEILPGQPTQQEIAGFKPDTNSSQNLDVPTVLRDARGNIRWNLPGNTPEENEQLGIRNVQGVFLEKFPEFLERFPIAEDGKIVEAKRDEAKKYVLDRIQNVKDFLVVLGGSVMARKSAPYFNGSHIVVMQKSFAPWGINIDKRDSLRRHRTIEEIKQEAAEFLEKEGKISFQLLYERDKSSLHYAIVTEYPGGLNQLKIDLGLQLSYKPNGYWTPDSIEAEAKIFYEQEGTLDNIRITKNVLYVEINNKYPGGISALEKKLGIQSVPQVDKQSQVYTDDAGRRWTHAYHLTQLLRINQSGATRILKSSDVPTILGRGKRNRKLLLYDENEVRRVLFESGYLERSQKRKNTEATISPDQAREDLWKYLEVEEDE